MPAGDRQMNTCPQCGAVLVAQEPGALCPACAISAAEQVVAGRSQVASLKTAEKAAARKRPRIPVWALVLTCIVCVGIIAWRVPALAQANAAQPTVRTGAYTVEGDCDACVANLWRYSEAMGFAFELPALSCPASGEPYVVAGSEADGTLEVSCPNPEAHGLRALGVTWEQRVPEARR